MAELETITLSKETIRDVKEKIISFFMQNSTPVHTHSFINCTLKQAIRGKGLVDRFLKRHDLFSAKKVTITKDNGKDAIVLHTKNAEHVDASGPMFWFTPGNVFFFTERKLFVQIPSTQYQNNRNKYIIRVFGDN